MARFLLVIRALLDPEATILVSEPSAIHREFALEHDATHVFDPSKEDIPTAVRKAVPPGVHVVFDTAGVQAALDASL
jgi:threonine dehydrogenase-like Zn-dependent dehydrogenase